MTYLFRSLVFITFVGLVSSCSNKSESTNESTAQADSTVVQEAIANGVKGDFDGDGVSENVLVRVLNNANFNPDEPWSYSIEFSNPRFKSFEISPMVGDGFMILNEGDIDRKKGDELSIVTCLIDGVAMLSLYKFDDKGWHEIAESVDVVCSLPEDLNWDDVLVERDSGAYVLEFKVISYDSITYKRRELLLADAYGDFDGDGSAENVYIKQVSDPNVDDTFAYQYSMVFSDKKVPPLAYEQPVPDCWLENEGNVNGKPGDELSIMRFGQMNTVIRFVYGFNGKSWDEITSAQTNR